MSEPINTILVEDHEITRLGLRKMLDHMPRINIVAELTSGRPAVEKARELHPQLIFMDIGMPEMDGIEATRLIKDQGNSKVIMITSHDNEEDVLAALNAGADAYCLKGVSKLQLENCVCSVMEGAVWLDPSVARKLVGLMAKGQQNRCVPKPSHSPFQLSEREFEILGLLVDGNTNQQMADKLYLSAETIKTHMRHIMEKLRVTDRTQAAIKAVTEGLVAQRN